jgi:hypothetical protein
MTKEELEMLQVSNEAMLNGRVIECKWGKDNDDSNRWKAIKIRWDKV